MHTKHEQIRKKALLTVEDILNQSPSQIFEVGKSSYVFASSGSSGKNGRCFGCAYCLLYSVPYLHKNQVPAQLNIGLVPSILHPSLTRMPVSVNNALGDPVIQWDDTLEKLKGLQASKHKGAVVLITKSTLSQRRVNDLLNFLNLKILVMVSISRLKPPVELSNYKGKVDTIARLTNAGFPVVTYFRPVIPGLNDSSAVINEILDDTKSAGGTILCYAGLMGRPEILSNLQTALGYDLTPPHPYKAWQTDLKLIDPHVSQIIEEGARCRGIEIYKKTSCAITNALHLGADYNVHLAKNPSKYNCHECNNLINCEKSLNIWESSRADVLRDLLDAEFAIEKVDGGMCELKQVCRHSTPACLTPGGFRIKLYGTYTLGEVALARMLTGVHVYADRIIETNQLVFPHGVVDRSIKREFAIDLAQAKTVNPI